jgi:hypothetical protein
MTHKLKQDDPDIACAKAILDKGWRQGTIFNPRGIVDNVQLTDGELLILCTQSCTVVSSRFATDPIVEAMVINSPYAKCLVFGLKRKLSGLTSRLAPNIRKYGVPNEMSTPRLWLTRNANHFT